MGFLGGGGVIQTLLTPILVPANAVVQRDGTVVTQRDLTIVVDQRP